VETSWLQSAGNSAISMCKNVDCEASQPGFDLSRARLKGLAMLTAVVKYTTLQDSVRRFPDDLSSLLLYLGALGRQFSRKFYLKYK
jgi:hypothetical protein